MIFERENKRLKKKPDTCSLQLDLILDTHNGRLNQAQCALKSDAEYKLCICDRKGTLTRHS